MILPVVLSGGSGTRLWPLSRKMHPKQLLPLVNETTLLQDTLGRVAGTNDEHRAIVICNEEYRFIVAEQVRATDIADCDILLEPIGRNTAPAIALAAHKVINEDIDPVMLVLPADHAIANETEFLKVIRIGATLAEEGSLVTFGIVPTSPETGYGYIKALDADNKQETYRIEKFVEKPNIEVATKYLEEGGYYWNSGMFMFKASEYLSVLKQFAPEIEESTGESIQAASVDMDFIRVGVDAFNACPSDSIDYAIMENSRNAIVVPADIGWDDVGSWSSLHQLGDKDSADNVAIGDVQLDSTSNTYVRADSKLVVALGVEDLIIVDSEDALLVAHRDKVQDIKGVVEKLSAEDRDEIKLHKKVCRPWGCYQGIDHSERFQVKRITVKPGAVLSLQMHHHRAEHWVIVNGTAKVTRDDDEFVLSENQSTYIPQGARHRLENIGKIPLELIEVQTGSYLGEDDIVRFDDVYGRSHKP